MRKIAHIINPVIVAPSSDLFVAQPITFATMKIAAELARGQVEVKFFSAQYPEDRALVPKDFQLTPNLERSVLDFGDFPQKRKLPLLADILDRLYEAAEAEYFIFTNVDIAVMPHFYTAVNAFIEAGHDAFVINRRTIERQYTEISQIALMYAEIGEPHEGHDCFVFRRAVYPQYRLGTVCTGVWYVGRVLLWNLAGHARKFREYKNKHLTFHLGNDRAFVKDENVAFFMHNRNAALRIRDELQQKDSAAQWDKIFWRYPIIDFEAAPPAGHVVRP